MSIQSCIIVWFLDSQVTRSRDSRATSLLCPRRRATIASASRATTRGNRGVMIYTSKKATLMQPS